MVILMKMRDMFPEWDSFLVTRREKWKDTGPQHSPTCEEAWKDLSGLYKERFGAELRLVHFNVKHWKALEIFDKVPGNENRHNRGHWPVEAYARPCASCWSRGVWVFWTAPMS